MTCQALTYGTPINAYLFNQIEVGGLNLTERTAEMVDFTAAYCMLAAAAFTLLRPCWPVLVPVAAWQLAVALADCHLGGKQSFGVALSVSAVEYARYLELPAHAARYVCPLALALLRPWPSNSSPPGTRITGVIWGLRLSASLMFLAHGVESLLLHPAFVDYLLVAAQRLLGWEMAQETAEILLRIIGAVDIAVAIALLGWRWRAVAFWMAFWGAVTAFARIVHGGWGSYDETLVRAAHAGVPLAVGLYWWLSSKPTMLQDKPT